LPVQRREFTLRAVPEQVRDARTRVADLAQEAGVAPDVLAGVRLAVSEAVANAVLHGYREGLDGDVTVVAESDGARLKVVVRDDGCGIGPRGDSPGAGLGLPLIAEVTETLSLSHGAGGRGTELSMTFALDGAPTA
jgi:anti-sigma regulatory factor (Ser/Thr protein kinase)